MLVELKTAEFENLVNVEGKVSIIDFWAPWCGYCVRMMPVFEKLAEDLQDKVQFVKVNTDEEPALAQKFNIEVLPTFVIVKDGQVLDRKIGYVPEAELRQAIEAHI